MSSPPSRSSCLVASGDGSSFKQTPLAITAPTKPSYWTTLLPSSVKYAGGDPNDIQRVLASITDKSTLDKTLVILADPDDPQRPLFVITTLRSRFFPRGNWCAYLYRSKSFHSDDYRLCGVVNLYLEPNQIPYWQTWRFLSRQLRAGAATATQRKLRKPNGLLIDPTISIILPLCGEAG